MPSLHTIWTWVQLNPTFDAYVLAGMLGMLASALRGVPVVAAVLHIAGGLGFDINKVAAGIVWLVTGKQPASVHTGAPPAGAAELTGKVATETAAEAAKLQVGK